MSPRRLDVPSAVLLLLLACGTQGARIQPDDVAPDVANERQEAAHGDGEGEVAGGAQEAAPPTRRASAASGAGAEEIKTYKWFSGFSWGECASGEMTAPHAELCAQLLATAEQSGAKGCLPEAAGSYTGDETWYDGFGSFTGLK